MANLAAGGGKVLQAVYPDTIVIEVGESVVEIRANARTKTVELKAIR